LTTWSAIRDEALKKRPPLRYARSDVKPARSSPLHRNTYFVAASRLDDFFQTWSEHGETVVDVRPVTLQEALREIRDFQSAAAGEGA
jgi:hypothetical protein